MGGKSLCADCACGDEIKKMYTNANKSAFGFGSKPDRHLDETTTTTLGIDFLEALLLLSLFDNAERSDEEA